MEQSGSIGVDACLLIRIHGIVEVVAIIRHILNNVIYLLLQVGDATSVVEQNCSDDAEEEQR